MSDVRTRIEDSLRTGFLDRDYNLQNPFQSKLITHVSENSHRLSRIISEQLLKCDSFTFQVAFITSSGLQLLKDKLLFLSKKGVSGRVLTSTMNDFNNPKMFRDLLKIRNIDVRIVKEKKFHSKGYLFSFSDHKTMIIGSSNLTATALRTNRELNVLLHSSHEGGMIDVFESTFNQDWREGTPLDDAWIDEYEEKRVKRDLAKSSRVFDMMPHEYGYLNPEKEVRPNKMQREALESLTEQRAQGNERALLISATGTGKTYLSAFDVKEFDPERCLYIAHREQILIRSKESFQRVISLDDEDCGVLSGTSKDFSKKFVFATIQSLVKESNLERFAPDDFDYIIIDEVHRAGAPSYSRIIEYFQPVFMLGMSATPERTDEFNVFELFHNNVAYEIRLQRALEENLLVPFHYFGVSDFEINGEVIDDQTRLNMVDQSERMRFLLEKMEYYGHGGDSLTGLVFCSRRAEGEIVAELLCSHGYNAVFLSGKDSQERRTSEIERLENGELDYIVTVDIFNEGIDIPSINQVVMLRQTQSSIVFIQQIGRGLRLDEGKDYLTVIDFIGNYKNNFLIPIALSGSETYEKDDLRAFLTNSEYMTGLTSVNFEEVAKDRIYQSINNSTLGSIRQLKESYRKLKRRLDRIPLPTDFLEHHSVDPTLITKKMSYSEFLCRNGEEGYEFGPLLKSFLNFIGKELMNGHRLQEVDIVQSIISNEVCSIDDEVSRAKALGRYNPRESIDSALRLLSLDFFTSSTRKKYEGHGQFLIIDGNEARFSPDLEFALRGEDDFRSLCEDILKCAIMKNTGHQSNGAMKVHEKYGRKDVCRLLNWDRDESSTVYGYRTKHRTCPIFITYQKSEDIEGSVRYEDEFLNQRMIRWFTKSRRTLDSKEVGQILNHNENQVDLHIFVKKSDSEGTGFYYLGIADLEEGSEREERMPDSGHRVVTMHLSLRNEIPMSLYDYLIG